MLTATATTGLLAPGLASAQVDEVIVTATRRGETALQTTPVAISVVGQEDFAKLFATDIGEISQLVPNFSAATVTGFNAASFAMRGAGETDIIVYFDPKVGVLVDDFVVPHVQTQLLEPFDIQSIEVLRGPQGTLFGKNTTAGAVVLRTIRPELGETSVDVALQAGNIGNQQARFAANLPIGDNWAFRFAGIYQKTDGYYTNGKVDFPNDTFGAGIGDAGQTDGSPVTGDGSTLGGKDVLSMRAKLLWQPTDDLTILGQYEYIEDSSKPVPVVNETPAAAGQIATLLGFPGVESGDPLDQAGIHSSSVVNLDGSQQIDVNGVYLNLEWVLGNSTLYANLGRRDQESRLPNEYLGTPYESFFAATRDDNRETTQFEVRLASNANERFNYVVGGFYQQNDAEFCVLQQLGLTEFFGSAAPGILDNQNPLLICNRQDATAMAVFAEASINVTERFTLALGGRYTDEEKDFIAREGLPTQVLFPGGEFNEPLDGQDYSLAPFAVQTDSQSWQEPTYRFTASYAFTDDLFSYFTYTRGFKSGGYNDQAGSGGFQNFPLQAYNPEFADSYELGLKSTFADGAVTFNATVFFVTYEDFQRSTVVSIPGTAFQETRTFNAAEVEASGIEAELFWRVTDNFTLNAHVGTLDAKYNEFLLDRNNDGVFEDFSGRDVVRAPEVNGGVNATYIFDLSGGSNVLLNANYKHEAENTYYYNDDIGQEFDTILDQRDIFNANVTWTSADNQWSVSAFGKNLTDERYRTASQAVGTLWTFANYGPPRTYGVEVGFRFAR
jgi:iron complex outermembrane receptor protein